MGIWRKLGQFAECAPALIATGMLLGTSRVAAAAAEPNTFAGDLKKLSIDELLDVQVTSVSRRPENRLDTAAAVQVITGEDIRRSAVTTLPEALRLAPNLNVARIDSGNWAISARGFNSGLGNKLLVMIDGRTVYTPLFAGVFWDVQDALIEDIDRIEVVAGPGGTLWGANAVNGVISVITRSAAETQGLFLQGGAGNELQDQAAMRYGGTFGPAVHFKLYGKYLDHDASIQPDGTRWTDDVRTKRGGFRFDWSGGAGDELGIQGDLYDGESGQLVTANHATFNGSNVLGRWERAYGSESKLSLQLYCDKAHRHIEGHYTDDVETCDIDLQHLFHLGSRHDFVWGLGARQFRNTFESAPTLAFQPPQLTHRLFSAFLQDEVALGDARLTLGAKLEHNDYTGFELQPNIRLAVKPSDDQTVWAAVSRAVRAPSRVDRDLYIPSQPPFLIAGGPGFVSEVLVASELGYRIQPWARLSLDLATFYNDYANLRSVEPAAPPAPFPYQVRNGLDGESHGFELSADYRAIDRWRLAASYRYLDMRLHVRPGHLDTTSVNSEAHDPRQQLTLRSMLDLTANLQLDVAYRSVARIVNDQVPGYDEVDLRLAWRPLEKLEVAILGQNLLHDHHPEFSPLASRHEIERNVFGKVTWGF